VRVCHTHLREFPKVEYSRTRGFCHIFTHFSPARRAEPRSCVIDTEWHPQRTPPTENPGMTLSPPESASRESGRISQPRPIPNSAGSQSHPELFGIWNESQYQRPTYETPSPLLDPFSNGRNVPATPWIPFVPLPDVRRSSTRSAFGQPPNVPWVQPSIFQPGAQRTPRERSNSIWQPNIPPVINSPQVVHSRWAIPWANYEILGGWPTIHDDVYRVPLHRQQENTDNGRRQRSDTCSNNRRERIPDILSKGELKWDIRFQPCTSAFDPPRSFFPDLDSPALSDNNIHVAEICFSSGRGMKVFTDTWGSIYVQSGRRRYSPGRDSSPISIRDILDATYRYFMQPLTEQETARFEAIAEKKDEMVMAYRMRLRAHRARDDFYRRCDLLQNGMNNFDKLEFEGESRNMVRLRLRLY